MKYLIVATSCTSAIPTNTVGLKKRIATATATASSMAHLIRRLACLPGPAHTATPDQPSLRTAGQHFHFAANTDTYPRKANLPPQYLELTPSCGLPSCSWSIAYSFRRPWLLLLLDCFISTQQKVSRGSGAAELITRLQGQFLTLKSGQVTRRSGKLDSGRDLGMHLREGYLKLHACAFFFRLASPAFGNGPMRCAYFLLPVR